MEWEWKIRITDLIMIVAIIIGPIVAVRLTECLRHRKDVRDRKVHIFRTLMSTRSAPSILWVWHPLKLYKRRNMPKN